jgi:hypothetical protein
METELDEHDLAALAAMEDFYTSKPEDLMNLLRKNAASASMIPDNVPMGESFYESNAGFNCKGRLYGISVDEELVTSANAYTKKFVAAGSTDTGPKILLYVLLDLATAIPNGERAPFALPDGTGVEFDLPYYRREAHIKATGEKGNRKWDYNEERKGPRVIGSYAHKVAVRIKGPNRMSDLNLGSIVMCSGLNTRPEVKEPEKEKKKTEEKKEEKKEGEKQEEKKEEKKEKTGADGLVRSSWFNCDSVQTLVKETDATYTYKLIDLLYEDLYRSPYLWIQSMEKQPQGMSHATIALFDQTPKELAVARPNLCTIVDAQKPTEFVDKKDENNNIESLSLTFTSQALVLVGEKETPVQWNLKAVLKKNSGAILGAPRATPAHQSFKQDGLWLLRKTKVAIIGGLNADGTQAMEFHQGTDDTKDGISMYANVAITNLAQVVQMFGLPVSKEFAKDYAYNEDGRSVKCRLDKCANQSTDEGTECICIADKPEVYLEYLTSKKCLGVRMVFALEFQIAILKKISDKWKMALQKEEDFLTHIIHPKYAANIPKELMVEISNAIYSSIPTEKLKLTNVAIYMFTKPVAIGLKKILPLTKEETLNKLAETKGYLIKEFGLNPNRVVETPKPADPPKATDPPKTDAPPPVDPPKTLDPPIIPPPNPAMETIVHSYPSSLPLKDANEEEEEDEAEEEEEDESAKKRKKKHSSKKKNKKEKKDKKKKKVSSDEEEDEEAQEDMEE